MIDIALGVLAIVGFVVACATYVFNSSTPFQPGPAPFFGGVALMVVCVAALIARHIMWR